MRPTENHPATAPVFILSCPRSGSTLLRCIVDTHPEFCSPAQLGLGPVCAGLFNAAYYSLGQLPGVANEAERERIALVEVRQALSSLMDRYTLGKGKRRWCEKSTVNIDHLALLDKVFPEARYICLYRNSMDVVHSCLKFSPLGFMPELMPYVARRPDNLVAALAEHWLDQTGKLLAFEAETPSRCFRIGYEALVSDPGRVLPGLFAFLGSEWDAGLLDSIFTSHHDQGGGDIKVWLSREISQDSLGRGASIPSVHIPDSLRGTIDALHAKLGYPTLAEYYSAPCWGSPAAGDIAARIDQFMSHELGALLARQRETQTLPKGVCQLIVQGAAGGVWSLDLTGPESRIGIGERQSADCTLALADTTLCQILAGEKTVAAAYEQGEIDAGGDLGLAIQFGRLLLG
ncbi:SCP-2 sterol transfer family protein [Methylomagnum ishizawai]|uniref:SCP-2 sterol transfer family protein n=1 Tax=Methylomagnum ishizawai TaxID=1760988 RepID=A0A1Y6D3Q3_9GAMM|nr:sulfotransferase [Methylomagnum ishizawai]SMF97569.1 SCP-2 sterol transfer family protein [Methylomagnum ishizawai]